MLTRKSKPERYLKDRETHLTFNFILVNKSGQLIPAQGLHNMSHQHFNPTDLTHETPFDQWDYCENVALQHAVGNISTTKALATIEHYEFEYEFCEITGFINLIG